MVIYRRHKSTCKHKANRISKQCRCALWCKGTLEGKPYQRSLKTRNFERAEQIVKDIEQNGAKSQKKEKGILEAFMAFIAECEARNLAGGTLRRYRALSNRLKIFVAARKIHGCPDFTPDLVRDFRGSWTLAPRTARKELERLKAFFKFCAENGWIEKSPAQGVKAPEVRDNPTLPFSDSEIARIFAQAQPREATFFRVLLNTGLRIADAATLRPEKIIDGKLFLYTQKTGTPVFIPLPPDLLDDLYKLTLVGGFYFAIESADAKNIAEYYRRKLLKCAVKAGLATKKVKGTPRRKNEFHPHRWRDTFAVHLLERGVALETVSILLGHTDLKTTQRSYAPWVKSRQDLLEEAVTKTWRTELRRVK